MSHSPGTADLVSRGAGALAAAAACLLAGLGGVARAEGPAQQVPRRVLSLNLCADQLLLVLLPPERIASLTWLSRSEGDPDLAPLARRLPANHGSAEEVLAANPDLVIAGDFTTAATRRLLARTATPLVQLAAVTDWAGIRAVTRQVAAAVGEIARGEALLAEMDATLAQLERTRPARPVRVIGWGGGGSDVPGRDTLFDQILTAAGGQNVGAALAGRASVDIEQLLMAHPEVLLRGAAYAAMPALRNQAAEHPLIRRLYPQAQLTYPEALYGCGVPKAAQAALQLRARLLAVRAASERP
jgi:iron complex transport system substrate-binding protein